MPCILLDVLRLVVGKIVNTPEVVRVFIGSFWKQPLQYANNRLLFELEHQDLFKDLQGLPKQNSLRKLNDFIRRARLAKVYDSEALRCHKLFPICLLAMEITLGYTVYMQHTGRLPLLLHSVS